MFFLSKIENQTEVSAYPWSCWEKLTFDQNFPSEHQIFLFENFCLSKKRRLKVMGAFRKLGVGQVGEQKPSVTDLKNKHLTRWLL